MDIRKTFLTAASVGLLATTCAGPASAQYDFGGLPETNRGNARYHNPGIDFDSDSCFPSSAVQADGTLNKGVNDKTMTGGCRKTFHPETNIYVRSTYLEQNGKTYAVHVYGVYFVKDFIGDLTQIGGHDHDWEHIIVYATDNKITHGGVSAHGGMDLRKWENIPFQRGDKRQFNVVYHKDGVRTHALRFAEPTESKEIGYKHLVPLSWREVKPNIRKALNNQTHFGKATLEIRDDRYPNFINKWRPQDYPEFVVQGPWKSSLEGTGNGVTSVGVSEDGKSMYTALRGTIVKLDTATGTELGRKHLDGRGGKEVRLDVGKYHLYAGVDGYVYALNPESLKIDWKKSLPGTGHGVTSVHAREDVGAVFAACNGHVQRLYVKNGQVTGRNDLKDTGSHEVRLASDANSLYVGTNGYVFALNLSALGQQWKNSLKDTGEHVTSLHVRGASVYATCGGQLLRLRSGNGNELARRKFRGKGKHEIRMSSNSKYIYVGMNGDVMACDLGSLSVKWYKTMQNSGVSSVAVDGGWVYAACHGRLYKYNADNGQHESTDELKGTGEHEVRLAVRRGVGLFAGTNGQAFRSFLGN